MPSFWYQFPRYWKVIHCSINRTFENEKIVSLTAVALKSGTVGGSEGHPPSFWDWTNEQYEISNAEIIVNWIMVSVC